MTCLRNLAVAMLAVLPGCASAPLHYHTLVPAAANRGAERSVASSDIEALTVRVPAAADRMELIVRRSDSDASIINQELWIAPLADELRSALLLELARQMSTEPETSHALRRVRIRLDVQRLEAVPGRYALIDAQWRVSTSSGADAAFVDCVSHVAEPVGESYAAIVVGYQRALVSIADAIAVAVREARVGAAARCTSR